MSGCPAWALSPNESADWERFSFGDFEFGEVTWLRRDERFEAGFFRVGRAEYETSDLEYTVSVDQFGIVLQGGVTVELGGEMFECGVGDAVSVRAGSTVRAQLSGDRFLEFFVRAVEPHS